MLKQRNTAPVCPVSHVPDAHLATHLLFCVGGAWAGEQLGFIVVCESELRQRREGEITTPSFHPVSASSPVPGEAPPVSGAGVTRDPMFRSRTHFNTAL